MSIQAQIKEPLVSRINKAFNKLKNQRIVKNKNDFIMMLLDNAIDDLYKNKIITP
tara:strand:+ start:1362 stop:1526 length:165 start_codon:yes stop_codon:yes gene_type:complete